MTTRPDARGRRIRGLADARTPPEDPADRALYDILIDEGAAEDDDLSVALALYRGNEHHVLDALLLVQAKDETIAEGLAISQDVVAQYRTFFFDVTVFKHVFAARQYVKALPEEPCDEFKAYELALHEGADALLARYRLGDLPPVDPVKATERSLAELHLRSREHRGLPLTSKTAQESLKCARAVVEASSALRNMQPKGGGLSAAQELITVLQAAEHTVRMEQLDIAPEDLVRTGPVPAPT
jgi:hypothetical protein